MMLITNLDCGCGHGLTFASAEEEAAYWKSRFEEKCDEYEGIVNVSNSVSVTVMLC